MEKEKLQYEMFFKSEDFDAIKIDGWVPIDYNRIKHPERIDKYIANGLLRVVEPTPTPLEQFKAECEEKAEEEITYDLYHKDYEDYRYHWKEGALWAYKQLKGE